MSIKTNLGTFQSGLNRQMVLLHRSAKMTNLHILVHSHTCINHN